MLAFNTDIKSEPLKRETIIPDKGVKPKSGKERNNAATEDHFLQQMSG